MLRYNTGLIWRFPSQPFSKRNCLLKMIHLRTLMLACACLLVASAQAQSSQNPTATPAAAEASTSTPSANAEGDSDQDLISGDLQPVPLAQSFLQTDLDLLVGNVQRPNAMVWFEDHLYTVCNGDWTIYKIDDSTGDTITFVFGVKNGDSMLIEGTADAFDIWVPDPDSETVWTVDQERQAPTKVSTDVDSPWGIARLDDGRLLVTDTARNQILLLSDIGVAETIADELRAPTGIVVDGDRIYFANGGSARRGIEWIQIADDGLFSAPRPLVSGLQNTTNIVLAADGYLYFAYALGTRGVIARINPLPCLDSACDNADVEMVVFSDIPAPIAMTLSPDLRLFLHSRYRPEIYWVQLPV